MAMRRAALAQLSSLSRTGPLEASIPCATSFSLARENCVLRTWAGGWQTSGRAASGEAPGTADEEEPGPTRPLIGTRDDPSTGPPIIVSVTEEMRHAKAAHDTYKHFMKTHTIHYEPLEPETSSSAGDASRTPGKARKQGQSPSKGL